MTGRYRDPLTVACPICHAQPGEKCKPAHPRDWPHGQRWHTANPLEEEQ